MQHLDEGTIHSWLDGALTPEEAARVEAHAAGCPECAAAVAEARGFIAASSRILTSLDNAPRGVIPASAPRRRFDPFAWKIAATLLVVAAGTLVVARTRGADEGTSAPSVDTAVSSTSATAATAPAATAPAAFRARAPEAIVSKGVAVKPPAIHADAARGIVERVPTPTPTAAAPVAGVAGRRGAIAGGVAVPGNQRFGAPGNAAAVGALSAPAVMAPSQAADAATSDRAIESTFRVIAQPRRIGANVTVYEIDGDTVTLTESKPLTLESAVVTGAGVATSRQAQKAEPRQAATLNAQVAPATPSAAPAASMAKPVDSTNVIRWRDPATGSTFTLTGRVSAARLVELKARIERERAAAAAAAAAKKTP